MLTTILAHEGRSPRPGELWSAWNLDPLLIGGLVLVGWAYRRGRSGAGATVWRGRSFAAGLVAVAVALVSPLEAWSGALASAHMVQHVVLVLVAAPLLAFSSPVSRILRGSPHWVRATSRSWTTPIVRSAGVRAAMRRPAVVWAAHVGVLWFWHASAPYGAALRHEAVHILEHGMFLITGVLFWGVVARPRPSQPDRSSAGLGVLLLFAMALQSVFLAVLLTFATTPWYSEYSTTTASWGLDPLADQQLAGAIMWVPAGAVYVIAGLVLMASWLRHTEGAVPSRST